MKTPIRHPLRFAKMTMEGVFQQAAKSAGQLRSLETPLMKSHASYGILAVMSLLAARSPVPTTEQLTRNPRVAKALVWLQKNTDWVTKQQTRITEVPAPSFEEVRRATLLRKLLETFGLKARLDRTGNVIAERGGTNKAAIVLVAAHLDTVFPAGTDVRVTRNGDKLEAPGISDNGAGVAAMIAVARSMQESRVQTEATIAFVGDVGEEGEGNLRGIRALVAEYGSRLRAVIAVDGFSTEHITTVALASRRMVIQIGGPGGHSWSDFGAPNPITALSRAIVRFSGLRVPTDPRTTFNFGMMEGGTSINSIPARAEVRLDIRSESDVEIKRLDAALRVAVAEGIKEEVAASQTHSKLSADIRLLGERPGGSLPADSALLAAVQDVDRYLGNASRLERSSTDANIPLSLGIPAVAIGGGGYGGGAHSRDEWFDPTDRVLGLQRLLLAIVSVAGVES
jgi:tripeptide aminopeptidase